MGYWENTAYVRCGDVGRIIEAVAEIFALEGFDRCATPRAREPRQFDPMQYGTAAENPLWAVGVAPARPPWSVVKTAPFELLMERAAPEADCRLARLCRRLGADGFQYNVYDTSQVLLFEADARGNVRVSGFCENDRMVLPDDAGGGAEYNGEPVVVGDAAFGLIRVEPDVQASLKNYADDEALGRLLCGNSEAWSNLVQVSHLIPHRPPRVARMQVAYFRNPSRTAARIDPGPRAPRGDS